MPSELQDVKIYAGDNSKVMMTFQPAVDPVEANRGQCGSRVYSIVETAP